MTPLSVPCWIITLLILCKSSVLSINFDSMLDDNDTIEETTTIKPIICTKEISSNLSCPSGKYANSKCFCATCFEFGEPCTVDSQCCRSSHMSCWKFSGLSYAYCLCDESYSWDAYSATCFMPGNLPQQMLMITLYSFIAMIVVIAFLFILSHACDISICNSIKPRTDYENRDLTFLQEPAETMGSIYRDLPPTYSQIFPGYCSQDAMVNAGLDLALPLYSQAVAEQNTQTDEIHINFSDQRQLVTNHSTQSHYSEPPPAYEESSHAQMIRANTPSISIISGNINNSHLTETWYNIKQVPKIIITPSDTEETSYINVDNDPELITPPAALLQVPERLETEIVEPLNRPQEPKIIIPSKVYRPVFVSTMNIILEGEGTSSSTEDTSSLMTMSPSSSMSASTSRNNNEFFPQFCENNCIENSEEIQNSQDSEQQDMEFHGVLYYDVNQNLELNNVSEYTNNNPEINPFYKNSIENIEGKIAEIILNDESQLTNSVEIDMTSILQTENMISTNDKTTSTNIATKLMTSNNNYGESSHSSGEFSNERENISSLNEASSSKTETSHHNNNDTYESNRVFQFDYTKYCNFERSQAASAAFQPSVKSDDCSSYTSPACQM